MLHDHMFKESPQEVVNLNFSVVIKRYDSSMMNNHLCCHEL